MPDSCVYHPGQDPEKLGSAGTLGLLGFPLSQLVSGFLLFMWNSPAEHQLTPQSVLLLLLFSLTQQTKHCQANSFFDGVKFKYHFYLI